MTRFMTAIACFLTGLAAARADLSVGISTGATNITATSAWLQASVTATGAATPYLFAFWAKTNFSTNQTWTYTNAFGESTVGVYSVQATGLERGTMYHYRTYATNTTTSAWSSVGYTFRTLSSTTPTPLDAYSVTAKSNGDLLGPTNFFFANSQEIARAAGAGGALTNEPLWSAESNNLAQATNSLNDRVGANYTNNEATSNRAEAIYNDLTGRVAIVSNRTDALQAATNDLNVRLEAATNSNAATSNRAESIYNDLTGRVAIVSNRTDDLQAATNDLNARLEAATNNNAATSNRAEAIYSDLTGRVAIVSNRTDALQAATNSLNDRAKALEDATNLLNAATNNLNTRLKLVEGGGLGGYPVFLLHVGTYDSRWTDFSIKASTNGFTPPLVYYHKTWDTDSSAKDNDPMTIFADDYQTDPRKHYRATNALTIYEQLQSEDSVVREVLFYPSRDLDVNADDWLFASNTNLIWSWVRYDQLGPETNAAGDEMWNIIEPFAWQSARPAGTPWGEEVVSKLPAAYVETFVTWRTNVLDGTNCIYFVNPHNGSNYYIMTP